MDTIPTIIITAIFSSFITFLFTEYVRWKISARKEILDENRKLLEELYSPLITILDWMSIRTMNQIESDEISEKVPMQENKGCSLVLHPHQYDRWWNIRSKYMHMFSEEDDEKEINLKMVDDIFLNLCLFMNESGSKERWIFNIDSIKKAEELKNKLIRIINTKMSEIRIEIKRWEKQSDNLGRRIQFLLTFWKI